jgi:hypothetical protein
MRTYKQIVHYDCFLRGTCGRDTSLALPLRTGQLKSLWRGARQADAPARRGARAADARGARHRPRIRGRGAQRRGPPRHGHQLPPRRPRHELAPFLHTR